MMRALLIALIVVGAAAFWFFPRFDNTARAAAIVEICAAEKDPFCYEREIPALYPGLPLDEVFAVIREVRDLDPSYQFCHVAAHKLGEVAVAEDPAKWLDLIPQNPRDGLCSNGFIHGLIVGRFRNDTLDTPTLENTIPDFARACEPRPDWSPSRLDQAICYHGMGHLFMFITNADIRKSLDVCARIAESPTGNFMRVCREGVFMQIYQPLEPDDYALIELLPEKPTRGNYRRLCAAYGNSADEGACLREAWPFFREEILTGTGIEAFCSGQPNAAEEDACYESATTIIGRQLLHDAEKAAAACRAVPIARHAPCFSVVAQAILEEDRREGERALAFCARAPDAVRDACASTLASRARWLFGASPEREQFCALLPMYLRESCRN